MDLLEKIISTKQFAITREALLLQVHLALATLHTLDVPRAVEHVEQEAVQNGLITAWTLRGHVGARRGDHWINQVVARAGCGRRSTTVMDEEDDQHASTSCDDDHSHASATPVHQSQPMQ